MNIYITTNLINGKKYVGRDSLARKSYLGSGVFLKQAILKYGREKFVKEIIETCESMERLIEREKFWIEKLDAVQSPNFYNMSKGSGGFGPEHRHSEKTKKLISEKCSGKPLTQEQRNRIAAASSERTPHNKGKVFDKSSEEYARIYGNKKPKRPLSIEALEMVMKDYDSGMSFIDLSKKYERRIQQCHIDQAAKRLGRNYHPRRT